MFPLCSYITDGTIPLHIWHKQLNKPASINVSSLFPSDERTQRRGWMIGETKVSIGDLIRKHAALSLFFFSSLLMRSLLWHGVCVTKGPKWESVEHVATDNQVPLHSVILHLQIPNTLKPGLVWCAILFMLRNGRDRRSRDLVEKRQRRRNREECRGLLGVLIMLINE